MGYPEDAGTITPLVDGTDYMEDDNVNTVVTELEATKTLMGIPGAAQSHLATILDMLADNYTGGRCYGVDGTTDEVYVGAFSGIISNAAGSIRKPRRITTVTTLTASDLDTGAMAVGAYYIYATADTAASTPVFKFSASATTPTGYTYYKRIGWFYNETASVLDVTKLQVSSFTGGGNINQVFFQTGAVATGTTLMVRDDTIPQITEGDEYMTLAITPTSATNKLKIDVVLAITNAATTPSFVAGLFQDATTNAIAAQHGGGVDANTPVVISFTHFMTAGTTSATTFKVRAGCTASGTTTVNGTAGGRLYGGVMASSITITEEAA